MYYLFIICILHFLLLNQLEKIYFSYNLKNTNRPLEKCKNKNYNGCNGFPSGHAETITILCGYLLYNKIISIPVSVFIIIVICLQRLITNMHTLTQVTYGFYFGLIYSYLYWITNYSLQSLFITLMFIIIFTLIVNNIITEFMNDPIPEWVDPIMYDKIKSKKNKGFYVEILSIYSSLLNREFCVFKNWSEVEDMLDKAIVKIQEQGIDFDGVVGIKTGGAIISDYISKKLNIKNYKIKVSNKKKQSDNPILSFIHKYSFENEYYVEEGVDESIDDKNIILIDECIYSGVTMDTAIDYLKPKVKHIYPIVLNSKDIHTIDTIDNNYLLIWPWGYDN